MVLAHSRATWAELVVDLGVDSLRRSLVRASVSFGGEGANPLELLRDARILVVLTY